MLRSEVTGRTPLASGRPMRATCLPHLMSFVRSQQSSTSAQWLSHDLRRRQADRTHLARIRSSLARTLPEDDRMRHGLDLTHANTESDRFQ
jgi:hypothetical protein